MLATAPAATTTKAVFVDGPSAHKMKAALGIGLVNFQGLYQVLVHRVGSCRCLYEAPLITVHPEVLERSNGFRKTLQGAGFNVLPAASEGSADDLVLKKRIQALSRAKVSEIVIMTGDQDFVPELRCKASEGIRVHWVARKERLSENVLSLCHDGIFDLVDVGKFTGQITRTRDHGIRHSPCVLSDAKTRFEVTLNNRDAAEHRRLLGELQRLRSEFHGLSFTVEE